MSDELNNEESKVDTNDPLWVQKIGWVSNKATGPGWIKYVLIGGFVVTVIVLTILKNSGMIGN